MEENKAKKTKPDLPNLSLPRKKKGKYRLFHILSLKKKNEKRKKGQGNKWRWKKLSPCTYELSRIRSGNKNHTSSRQEYKGPKVTVLTVLWLKKESKYKFKKKTKRLLWLMQVSFKLNILESLKIAKVRYHRGVFFLGWNHKNKCVTVGSGKMYLDLMVMMYVLFAPS